MRKNIFVLMLLLVLAPSFAQTTDVKFHLVDSEYKENMIAVTVILQQQNQISSVTNLDGIATFKNVPYGDYTVIISYIGYSTLRRTIKIDETNNFFVFIMKNMYSDSDEITYLRERDYMRATASYSAAVTDYITNISHAKIENHIAINPFNISNMPKYIKGVRMQQTNLSTGNQSLRLWGMDGHHTLLMSNGMPLFNGFSNELSLLQIPNLDISYLTLYQGSAASLYGEGATAAALNIRLKESSETEFNVSQTHRGGTSASIYYGNNDNKLNFYLHGAVQHQVAYDPDGDGFSNMPQILNYSFHPKLKYAINNKNHLTFYLNYDKDQREGGDIEVIKNGISDDFKYLESNNTNRMSTLFSYEHMNDAKSKFVIRNRISYFDRTITLPNYIFSGEEINTVTQFKHLTTNDRFKRVLGASVNTSNFVEKGQNRGRNNEEVTISAFANHVKEYGDLSFETVLRGDYNLNWGFFPLISTAVSWHASDDFNIKLSGGTGYKLPNIFRQEAMQLHYQNVLPISKTLVAEKSLNAGANFYLGREIFGKYFSFNHNFIFSQIRKALVLTKTANNQWSYVNANGNVQTLGMNSSLVFYPFSHFSLGISYEYVDTRLRYLPENPVKPLTPKHNLSSFIGYSNESWRINYDIHYTGQQFLGNGSKTKDFVTMNFFLQKHFRWGSPYISVQNMTDIRQSRFSPEVSGTRQAPVFQELYAPTAGAVITIGLHIRPTGHIPRYVCGSY